MWCTGNPIVSGFHCAREKILFLVDVLELENSPHMTFLMLFSRPGRNQSKTSDVTLSNVIEYGDVIVVQHFFKFLILYIL